MNLSIPWHLRYRIRLYVRNSVWIPPAIGIFLAFLTAQILDRADISAGHESRMAPDAARTVLVTLASAMFTFIVFVSSMLLLALQLASSQLTPRAIALLFRDSVTKRSSALFAFTFTLVMAVVVRISDAVPVVETRLAAYCCVISLGVFFYMIDHIGKALRPHEVMRVVASRAKRVIETVYAHPATGAPPQATETKFWTDHTAVTVFASTGGVLLACDAPGLVALALKSNCVIELIPQHGELVPAGAPLFHVYGGTPPPNPGVLRGKIAVGHERTMEQDPAFAFRIIVDIACKALSPAINDPTTAVHAIDQLHHLLRHLGQRRLDDGRMYDEDNHLRFVYRAPTWGDFVHLAVTEIRHYGGSSIQIVRRLRAMLEDLIQSLPPERAPSLLDELAILHRCTVRLFADPEDQAMADTSDSQGVGGAESAFHDRSPRPGEQESRPIPKVADSQTFNQRGRELRQRNES